MNPRTPKLYTINASQFLLCLFEHYHEGVMITDQDGIVVYYNKAMARLDGLDHKQVLGRSVTETYQLDASQSIILAALNQARPIINRPHIYKTFDGKLVNSISSAYPLFDNNILVGAVCAVADYSSLAANFSQSEAHVMARPEITSNLSDRLTFDDLIGRDKSMITAVNLAKRAALTPSSVMLIGETGTGKELFARAIHNGGPRASGPFMAINCAAIPSALLESVLFGTTKGAFTGAVDKAGLFELANGGTLFLDELNSMPLDLQPKLLRSIQDRKVRRIGSNKEMPISVKIVSAVNEMPFKSVEQGLMRSDLFYRLGVVMVNLPPLRERKEDIKLLLNHFLKKFNDILGYRVAGFSSRALKVLLDHVWPGNVRELEHAVEAVMNIIEPTETIIDHKRLKEALPLTNFTGGLKPEMNGAQFLRTMSLYPNENRILENNLIGRNLGEDGLSGFEKNSVDGADYLALQAAMIDRALRKSRGNVAQAARSLGFSPQRLNYQMKKHGLARSDYLHYRFRQGQKQELEFKPSGSVGV